MSNSSVDSSHFSACCAPWVAQCAFSLPWFLGFGTKKTESRYSKSSMWIFIREFDIPIPNDIRGCYLNFDHFCLLLLPHDIWSQWNVSYLATVDFWHQLNFSHVMENSLNLTAIFLRINEVSHGLQLLANVPKVGFLPRSPRHEAPDGWRRAVKAAAKW